MGNNYPSRIDKFKDHRDLIDDVEAGDINDIQDSVTQIEKVIGLHPTRYTGSQRSTTDFSTQITKPPNDSGGLESDVSGTLVGYDLADRESRTNVVNYDSIADRLDALESGGTGGKGGNAGLPCFHLGAQAVETAPTSIGIDKEPDGIRFPKPTSLEDPYNMFNGIGVSIQRGGFWVFHAQAVFTLQGTAAQNAGMYNISLIRDKDWIQGMSRVEHSISSPGNLVLVQTHRMSFHQPGVRMKVGISHNSAVTQSLRFISFSGFLVKAKGHGNN